MTLTPEQAQAILETSAKAVLSNPEAKGILVQGRSLVEQQVEVLIFDIPAVVETIRNWSDLNRQLLESDPVDLDELKRVLEIEAQTADSMTEVLEGRYKFITEAATVAIVAALAVVQDETGGITREQIHEAVEVLGPDAFPAAVAKAEANRVTNDVPGGMYI